MGVPKGTDNFSGYRKTQVTSNLRLIEDALKVLRKRKLRFQELSLLASEVAERAGIHRTTLCRNPSYKRLLLTYLATQPGASALVTDDDATPALLKAKLYDVQLEAKNLRSQLFEMKQKLSAPASAPQLPDGKQAGQPGANDWQVGFSNTVMLLKLVLERINADYEVIQVDYEKGELLDLAAPAGRQCIAGGQRAKAFLQAYSTLLEQEGKLGGQK